MKNKTFLTVLGIVSFVMLAYCIYAYIHLQSELTPDLVELSTGIKTIGNMIIPALAVVGIYHLVLLVNALKTIRGSFWGSLYIVCITLSGILLLSDLTLLSDIGKEYLLFDVTGSWLMIYVFTALHILAIIWGFIYMRKNPADRKLFEASNDREGRIFLSMHHIGLISGMLGFCGVIAANVQKAVAERFTDSLMVIMTGLALIPLILFAIYWIVKLVRIPRRSWLDEKQFSDTMFGALFSMVVAVPLYALICVMDLLGIELNIMTWILGVFFIQLGVFSSVILTRNRQE